MTNAETKGKSVSFSAELSLARLADHLLEDGDEQAVITFMDDDKEEWTRHFENESVRSLWGLLVGRYPDRPLSPDAHLEFDFEIDSMERIELSMALEEQIRAPVDESQLAEVDYVRDLMELFPEHEGNEDKRTGHAVTDPEKILAGEDVTGLKPEAAPATCSHPDSILQGV